MHLDVTYLSAEEEVIITYDDSKVLKASLGSKDNLILNSTFKNLQEEEPEVSNALKQISKILLNLQDV